jgi:hypothetical protein
MPRLFKHALSAGLLGAALIGINKNLANKLPAHGVFVDGAGFLRVWVELVAIADEQMTVGIFRSPQCSFPKADLVWLTAKGTSL